MTEKVLPSKKQLSSYHGGFPSVFNYVQQFTKQVLSVRELCEVLSISRSTLKKLVGLNFFRPLPGIRWGQKFPVSQLHAYLSAAEGNNQP